MSQPLTDDSDLEEELAQLLQDDHEGKPDGPEGSPDLKELEDRLRDLRLPSTPKENPSLSQSAVSLWKCLLVFILL